MEERRKFQGALNILSFNRHFYVLGLLALSLLVLSRFIISWPNIVYWITIFAFLYGLIIPLMVSAYVYDFSGFYQFNWLKNVVDDHAEAKVIVNINAGFDETSFIIAKIFPSAALKVFDFYNAKQHTEPAIKRARKVSVIYPGTSKVSSNAIPMADESADMVFLISAVHEIRRHSEKIAFLRECRRICNAKAEVIMVEHLRDFPNFLAFTVGFTHFFSRKTWQDAFSSASFSSFEEIKFTPFMSVFKCTP
jgi:hypothetical protein